jgi:hypothetical protein
MFTINKPNPSPPNFLLLSILFWEKNQNSVYFFFWDSHPRVWHLHYKTHLTLSLLKLITKFTLPAGVNLIALLKHYLKFEPICFHLLQRALGHHLKSKIENLVLCLRLYLRIIFQTLEYFNGLNCFFQLEFFFNLEKSKISFMDPSKLCDEYLITFFFFWCLHLRLHSR